MIMNQSRFNDNDNLICGGATDEQLTWFYQFCWWTEGVIQLVIGILGFIANCLVIPVLCTKKMSNIFNHLLIFLALFDNVYLLCSVLESFRKNFASSPEHLIIFIYSLYQLQNIAFLCSIYTTVLLAVQRYLAISRPIEYYVDVASATAAGRNWKAAMTYTFPVILFSVLFNMPKFFEFTIAHEVVEMKVNANVTVNETYVKYVPTHMRLDDNYVFYYINWARLVVTGLIPLLSLAILNWAIYRGIKRRKKTIQTMQSQQMRQQHLGTCSTVEELILFAIVFIFLICTLPRIVLNTYEMVSIQSIRDNLYNECFRLPLWVMVTTSFTYILATLNSSINFVVYCIMYSAFRRELRTWLNRFVTGSKRCLLKGWSSAQSCCRHTHMSTRGGAFCHTHNGSRRSSEHPVIRTSTKSQERNEQMNFELKLVQMEENNHPLDV